MGYVESGNRPLVPDEMPPDYRELMERCWDGDPSRRPPFAEVVEVLSGMASPGSDDDEPDPTEAPAADPTDGSADARSSIKAVKSRLLQSLRRVSNVDPDGVVLAERSPGGGEDGGSNA